MLGTNLNSTACNGSSYHNRSKLEVLFGPEIWREIAGKTVIDFGCGLGEDAIDMVRHGAAYVTGVDIRPKSAYGNTPMQPFSMAHTRYGMARMVCMRMERGAVK